MTEQTENINMNEDNYSSMKVVVKWISLIITILTIIYFVIYFGHGGLTQGRLAQFGDFVGGTLNPLLGFFTVGLLVWSIQIQMKELKATREELAATKTETELSRKAMEAQVQHLEEQAHQTQILRLISDQNEVYKELSRITLMSFNKLPRELEEYSHNSETKSLSYHDVIMKIYCGQKLDEHKFKILGDEVRNEYSGGLYRLQWQQIENSLCTLSLLTLQYLKLTNNIFVTSVYIRQPYEMMHGLYAIRQTKQVGDIIDQLQDYKPAD